MIPTVRRAPASVVRVLVLIAVVLAGTTGCSSPRAFDATFVPPMQLDTMRVHLEPLTPAHATLDHAAFMSSREHLRRTLHWGSWPRDDTTVEQNAKDLERHLGEFEQREAYAYTVLAPDGSTCIGCIYLDPVDDDPDAVALAYWVTEDAVTADLDEHLLRVVLAWIENEWPVERVVTNVHVENARGIALAEAMGLAPAPSSETNHVAFEWRR